MKSPWRAVKSFQGEIRTSCRWPDFISKLQIALKECYETEYWLELFQRAEIVDPAAISALALDCGAIRRMLISSVNTAKQNHQLG